MRTQVVIVGAGPAGLVLALLLKREGIDAIVLERQSRGHVEGRVRAGVLEQFTADLLTELGVGSRLLREGLVHGGINIAFDGGMFRIDLRAGTGGKGVIVYGQQEVMKDMFDAALARGIAIAFEVKDVAFGDLETDAPSVTYISDEQTKRVHCDFVVGCDGAHGVSRSALPAATVRTFERVYPFGWLGVLADVPPAAEELIYCNHRRGFALASMRSPTRSRYYIQCLLSERIEDWPDDRFWDELCVRLGDKASATLTRGTSFEKSITPLRSFVLEPLRHGRLFLAGDAGHIVPPTGAKGLNLAVADVYQLARALSDFYRNGRSAGLDTYSSRALARVWQAERFSWWLTNLTHRFPETDEFAWRMQIAELDYLRRSPLAQASFAENYVGLPIE